MPDSIAAGGGQPFDLQLPRVLRSRHRTVDRPALRALRRLSLLLFPLGCALAALAIGQDIDFDLLNYHFYNAYAFVDNRLSIDVYPASLQTLINPLLDLPTYFLIGHVPPELEAGLLAACQGVAPMLVYLIGRRASRSRVVALAAALAAAFAGGFASELGSSMGDDVVAVPLLLAVLFVVVAIDRAPSPGIAAARGRAEPALAGDAGSGTRPRRGTSRAHDAWWWPAAGLAAGVGAGLKFAELPVDAGIVLGVLAISGPWRERMRRLGSCAAGSAIGLLVTSGYWTAVLWHRYHDPIAFTQASFGLFHSPYVPAASLSVRGYGPTSLLQAVVFPVYVFLHPLASSEIAVRELSLPLAYVATALLLVVAVVQRALRCFGARACGAVTPSPAGDAVATGRDVDTDRYLVVTFAVGIALWMLVFGVYRYLIPVELLSPLVVFAAGRRIVVRLSAAGEAGSRRRGLALLFVLACVACMLSMSPANYWDRVGFGPTFFRLQSTPRLLANGRTDVVVESRQPMAFLYPLLPRTVIAMGSVLDMLTPANRRVYASAFASVRRAHGRVVVMAFGSTEPGGMPQLLAALGAPHRHLGTCDHTNVDIGDGYQPLVFCSYPGDAVRRDARSPARG